jgi:hypothetical protein
MFSLRTPFDVLHREKEAFILSLSLVVAVVEQLALAKTKIPRLDACREYRR